MAQKTPARRLPTPKPGTARYAKLVQCNSPALQRLSEAKPKRTPKRKPQVAVEGFPQWFDKPEHQAAAEWIAHNYYVDKLLGVTPHADLPQYSGIMDREAVADFLARLDLLTAGRSPAPEQGA